MKNLILIMIIVMGACVSTRPVHSKFNYEQQGIETVAILPFKVVFSDYYKRISRTRDNDWDNHQRLAGLSIQKSLLVKLQGRANKLDANLSFQSIILTNQILEEKGVPFSALGAADKIALAKLLKVDAVVWGTSVMEYDGRTMRNGMETNFKIYKNPGLLYEDTDFQDMYSQSDSPQNLVDKSLNTLTRRLFK